MVPAKQPYGSDDGNPAYGAGVGWKSIGSLSSFTTACWMIEGHIKLMFFRKRATFDTPPPNCGCELDAGFFRLARRIERGAGAKYGSTSIGVLSSSLKVTRREVEGLALLVFVFLKKKATFGASPPNCGCELEAGFFRLARRIERGAWADEGSKSTDTGRVAIGLHPRCGCCRGWTAQNAGLKTHKNKMFLKTFKD